MSTHDVEFTAAGYLVLSREVAAACFPTDTLLAVRRDPELWLLPTRGGSGGGLLLKQRNPAGERSVLLREVLGDAPVVGRRPAFWDAGQGALRVAVGSIAEARVG